MLDQVESVLRSVRQTAGPSIVSVGRDARGTGFVVAADRVLTNAHNLRDETVSVTFADATSAQATVHAVDLDGDLAVFRKTESADSGECSFDGSREVCSGGNC